LCLSLCSFSCGLCLVCLISKTCQFLNYDIY
jgi:hypothetical protein